MNSSATSTAAGAATTTASADWRAQAMQLWQARTRSERRGLLAAALALLLLFVWLLLVQPAWRTVREAPAKLDQLDAQLQLMQRTAAESSALRSTVPVSAAQAAVALKSATDRLGDKGRLSPQGDRATLTLNGASAESLRAWLVEARSAARARPVEAQLTRSGLGYSGSLVVQLSGATP